MLNSLLIDLLESHARSNRTGCGYPHPWLSKITDHFHTWKRLGIWWPLCPPLPPIPMPLWWVCRVCICTSLSPFCCCCLLYISTRNYSIQLVLTTWSSLRMWATDYTLITRAGRALIINVPHGQCAAVVQCKAVKHSPTHIWSPCKDLLAPSWHLGTAKERSCGNCHSKCMWMKLHDLSLLLKLATPLSACRYIVHTIIPVGSDLYCALNP